MKFTELPTPCFLVDEAKLLANLGVLKNVARQSGAKILLAQKAFSMFSMYPMISEYLDGTCASGLYEARLAKEHFSGETHVFCPAYAPYEFTELMQYVDHIIFNSFSQLKIYGNYAKVAGKSIGLRVNPLCSTQPAEHAMYDPASPTSRLGITPDNFQPDMLALVEGLHFHTLCEQNAEDLVTTLLAFEKHFGKYLFEMKWLNLGGGHHITRDDYDTELLMHTILDLRKTYDINIYLEPGEAVVLNAGYLVSSVLDFVKNEHEIAILDTSAACHMPDVLEMPYRPPVLRSGKIGEKAFPYQLAGRTCLAGDVIGDYSFDVMLSRGDQVVFEDMALYTMVKSNTFNGMQLPTIAVRRRDGTDEVIRSFGYEDFKTRLS